MRGRASIALVFGTLFVSSPAGAGDTLAEHGDLRRRDGDQAQVDVKAPLGTRAATKVAVYSDDDGLTVITPILSVSQVFGDSTTLSVDYDVDILTAATVDVRTAASPKFEEVRHGIGAAASHRIRDWATDLSGSISLSREADYASATFGLGFSSEFLDKNVTLGGGYSYVLNAVGRSETPFDHFLDTLHIHALSFSLTQILSPKAYLQLSSSLIGAFGYQASVYRFVPIFLQGQVDPADVNEDSLEHGTVRPLLRPPEQVPRERYRAALVTRLNYAFDFGLTLAPDYRFYADSWAITSHTLDLMAYQRLPLGLILRLRNRLYYQNAANFYERVYLVSSADELPANYTTDRELGTFWYDLVGVKLALELPVGPVIERLVFDVKADLQYTEYMDFAYLQNRTAFIVGGGILLEL